VRGQLSGTSGNLNGMAEDVSKFRDKLLGRGILQRVGHLITKYDRCIDARGIT